MSETRGWCFTLNNYTEDQFKYLLEIKSKYLIVGREIAPETGTPHLQGYIYFSSSKSFKNAKRLFPDRVHLEAAKGTPEQNKIYCSKGGDFKEIGSIP